ncbi:MAG: formylglycine-generating enzyme family protein, partial [Halobacteriovoraceae bacterium]|nr:formylglycine-generating enzyme family protein [Halobacteriovoraceae bacterium]
LQNTTAVTAMQPGMKFKDCDECPEMVVVNSGSYVMGSNHHTDSERPRHEVAREGLFAVGIYEVTREEFGTFVGATLYHTGEKCWTYEQKQWKERQDRGWFDPGFKQTRQDPVVCVSWEDAQAYVKWLTDQTGRKYRLLSEAEWEYVARAGTTTPFYYGSEINSDQANYHINYTESEYQEYKNWTKPVGSFEANAFGVYDMHGNVWEWVQDCWNDNYDGSPKDGTAWEEGDCDLRVLRGGSWNVQGKFLRSTIRGRNKTPFRSNFNGIRVAVEI